MQNAKCKMQITAKIPLYGRKSRLYPVGAFCERPHTHTVGITAKIPLHRRNSRLDARLPPRGGSAVRRWRRVRKHKIPSKIEITQAPSTADAVPLPLGGRQNASGITAKTPLYGRKSRLDTTLQPNAPNRNPRLISCIFTREHKKIY